MPKKMKAKARGGMARGGVQGAGVGGDIGRWLGDWVQSWLGFANGGDVEAMVADLPPAEQKQLIKEATADLKKAVKAGEVDLPADAPMMGKSVGGDIGSWLGDWIQNWLGFARGGQAMARGGMARGNSVFR